MVQNKVTFELFVYTKMLSGTNTLNEQKWHSMPLIDDTENEIGTLKRGGSTQIESAAPISHGNGARSLEDMLTAPSTFPALLLPTTVVKRSSLCIYEAAKPTTAVIKSKGIELQEVTLRSLNEKSLGIIIELKSKRSGKAVKYEIYIKQFHQKGKAYIDGRLKKGDRIVKVNGVIVGESTLAHFCEKQVWTFTIARSIMKAKMNSGFTCVAPKTPTTETANEESQQMLCNKFLEGVNKKNLFKEIKTSNKKSWWEKVTISVMGFEEMLYRSDSFINITGDGERVDIKRYAERSLSNPGRRDSKHLQIFYPQQHLYVFEPISEISPQNNLEANQ